MGEQIPDRNRHQAGAERSETDDPRHREGGESDQGKEAGQQQRRWTDAGRPEQSNERLRLRETVIDDRTYSESRQHQQRRSPAAFEQSRSEGPNSQPATAELTARRAWRHSAE